MNELNIKQDRFLVFGAGVSGRSAVKLLTALNSSVVLVEGDGPEKIDDFDVMILSPGIPRSHKLVKLFLSQSKTVIGELDLASRYIKTPILCVTGSNGKTTVCTMMADFLTQLGYKVFLGGNIGIPLSEAACRELNGEGFDFIVCEASSFQLESLSCFRAKVGALINLSFTHQERYSSFEDYTKAKLNLLSHSQRFIYSKHPLIEASLGGDRVELKEFKDSYQFGYEFMQLVGEHNKRNFEYCFQIIQMANISFSKQQAQQFIQTFQAPEFRVQKIAVSKNLIFYNDSKSTNLESTMAAVNCFPDKNVILIIGGKVRNTDVEHFRALGKTNLDSIYCFGEAALVIDQITGINDFETAEKLSDVFERLEKRVLDKNKVFHILFSPGFPSFDQYRNYIERGRHFNDLVKRVIYLPPSE